MDEQVGYIAVEKQEPLGAEQWLATVRNAVKSLKHFPKRARLADENNYRVFEVRQLAVGSQLLLFWVDDDQRKVWVVGLRGAAQRPRPQDLPNDLSDLE